MVGSNLESCLQNNVEKIQNVGHVTNKTEHFASTNTSCLMAGILQSVPDSESVRSNPLPTPYI